MAFANILSFGNGPVSFTRPILNSNWLMTTSRHFKLNTKVAVLVCLSTLLLLVVCTAVGLWQMREIERIVSDQFNAEQLEVAHNIKQFVEREFGALKKEITILAREIGSTACASDCAEKLVSRVFSRVQESGVKQIEILDMANRQTALFRPYSTVTRQPFSTPPCHPMPVSEALSGERIWISQPHLEPSGIMMQFAVCIPNSESAILIFHVNASWLLTPYLKGIRSGKTGYAWIINQSGKFLYHPQVTFVGKDAFTVREARDPSLSYGRINSIQKEEMLKGHEGMGWYYSGWHRGITGKIKKLIAYCPVTVAKAPHKFWSIAVVAPTSEIKQAVHDACVHQMIMQLLVVLIIVIGAAAILFFEMRWSSLLEKKVRLRTEELQRSEEKYRSLVESAEDFIFTTDTTGCFQSMNNFTASFFGGRPEDFLGRPLSSLFPEAVADEQEKRIQLVFQYEKSVRDEFKLQTGDNCIFISANFMPLRSENGGVNAVLCIARDITENKNLERQLINAEKLASLGTLAAGVAHEINNPLGVILGFCDLLLQKTDTKSQDFEDLKTIERQGMHCREVVENLLSFARLGNEGSEYANLNDSLAEIIKVVRHTLEMNDIELVTEWEQMLPMVKGDCRQLQQVFLNLINNAAFAMAEGGRLLIRTRFDRTLKKAVAEFIDNGPGIASENLDHIYEPFFTTKPEGEGTGLGLFVSYGIISKFGGTIECSSRTQNSTNTPQGTTFTVRLLIRKGEDI